MQDVSANHTDHHYIHAFHVISVLELLFVKMQSTKQRKSIVQSNRRREKKKKTIQLD